MPATKEELLNIPEKLSDQFVYADAVRNLVEQKKKELADLNHNMFLINNQYLKLQSDCVKEKMDFDQKLRSERTKFDNEMNIKRNDFSHREQKIQQGEQNQNDRLAMIRGKEEQIAQFEEEKKKVYQERIDIEKFKNASQIEYSKTMALRQEAQTKMDNAAMKEAQSNNALQKAKDLNAQAEGRLGAILEKEKSILQEKENIEKLRAEITPKIEELETKRTEIDKNLKQIKLKEAEIDAKLEQDRAMLLSISNRESILKSKEIDITSRTEEVMRKELLLKK